jgi:hypothetical protein
VQSFRGEKKREAASFSWEMPIFVICNMTVALTWLHFLVHLISRWNYLAINIRDDAGALLMFFSFLWLMLIREKRNTVSLLMAVAVFMTAYEIVRTLM